MLTLQNNKETQKENKQFSCLLLFSFLIVQLKRSRHSKLDVQLNHTKANNNSSGKKQQLKKEKKRKDSKPKNGRTLFLMQQLILKVNSKNMVISS